MNQPPPHTLTDMEEAYEKEDPSPEEEEDEEEEELSLGEEAFRDEEEPPSASHPSSGSANLKSVPGAHAVEMGGDGDALMRSSKQAPPPSSGASVPPHLSLAPQQPQSSKNSNKKQINKHFREVRETGKWGRISKQEIYIAVAVLLLVIGGVVAATLLVFLPDDNDNSPRTTPPPSPPKSPPPTPAPTVMVVLEPSEELALIRTAVEENPHTKDTMFEVLPDDVDYYQNKRNDVNAPPQVRAVSWLLFDDPIDNPDTLLQRYALGVLYYSTNGDNWKNSQNWLSPTHFCGWAGLECDRFQVVLEVVNLQTNQLVGPIPHELNFLETVRALELSNNKLEGELPGLALGSLPALTILYVNNNTLTGEVSEDLRANGVLGTLFVQLNNFSGVFPLAFCPRRTDDPPVLNEFGLDCDKLDCFCCEPDNCF